MMTRKIVEIGLDLIEWRVTEVGFCAETDVAVYAVFYFIFLSESFRQVTSEVETLSEEDEAVANDLDLHALIVSQNHSELEGEPLQSAEDVIKEIDDLMQVSLYPHCLFSTASSSSF